MTADVWRVLLGALLVISCEGPRAHAERWDGGETGPADASDTRDAAPGVVDGNASVPEPDARAADLPASEIQTSSPDADADVKPPVKVGLLAPKTGVLQDVGKSFERVAIAAVANINAAGGIHGRQLQLIVEDTQSNQSGGVNLGALVTQGAIAVVGPATSGEVSSAAPIAKFSKIPFISPSSTAAHLASPTGPDDGGFMFRNAPDDNVEAVAIAYYLRRKLDPAVGSAALLYGDSEYAAGLRDTFKKTFEGLGGATLSRQVVFQENIPDLTTARGMIDRLAEQPAPATVVLIASEQDALKLVTAWYNDGNPTIPNLRWFLSSATRSSRFLVSAPVGVRGTCGTAPIYPTEAPAYLALKSAYEGRHPDKIDQQVFGPNVWDAFHLIAAAIARQTHQYPGQPIGGEQLRDALTIVSRGGQIFDAAHWSELTAAVRAGTDIDYDGASGPNDFDASGQVVGPFEVWCISADGNRFERKIALSAQEISTAITN